MKLEKVNRVMETFWLVIAICAALFGAYMVGQVGVEEGIMYIIMPFVAAMLWMLRRSFRKKLEKRGQEENQDSNN